jgi:hypothetical protein
MKDPCEECIVKVNCTQVCPDKENYKILLRNAVEQNKIGRKPNGVTIVTKHYTTYRELLTNTYCDIANIHSRLSRLKRE